MANPSPSQPASRTSARDAARGTEGPATPRRSRLVGDGCGFILVTTLVTALLMIINGGLVAGLYGWLASVGPPLLQHPRVAQASLFVLPVLLLLVQWWIIDRCLEWFQPGSRGSR